MHGVSEQCNKKFDRHQNNLLLKNFHWIATQETKMFYHKLFSHKNVQWSIFPKLRYYGTNYYRKCKFPKVYPQNYNEM